MLTATQIKSLQTTTRAVNQSFQLIVFTVRFWNRRVILPMVDHMYGNACAWEEWVARDPFAQELKSVVAEIFISLPFLLGILFRQWCESLVNQSLSTEGKAIALGYTEDQLDAFKTVVTRVNQSVETKMGAIADEAGAALDAIKIAEPVVNQSVETDYNEMGTYELRKVAANANMPGARKVRE